VGGRLGRIEQRIRAPNLIDILEAEMRVLEEVCGLVIDLERVVFTYQIEVEALGHMRPV
jgi:hypothetical protein